MSWAHNFICFWFILYCTCLFTVHHYLRKYNLSEKTDTVFYFVISEDILVAATQRQLSSL